MRRPFTLLFSLLAALGLVFAFPALASAHDVLQKTTPSDGQTLARMPASVSLQFSEAPLAIGTQVLVKGPGGDVATGKATLAGSTLVQAISPSAPAGAYTVTYRVTSDDGHPVVGTFAFQASAGQDGSTPTTGTKSVEPVPTLTQGASTPAATAAAVAPSAPVSADPKASTLPVVLTVLGVIVVIAIGGFLVMRSRPKQ